MDVCSDMNHLHSDDNRTDSDNCEHCNRPRCRRLIGTRGRCKRCPKFGIKVCESHGGQLPGPRMASAKALMKQQISENVFWQGEAPLLDPGEAMLRIASRLQATSDQLGLRLDAAIERYDERQEQGSLGACECCGHDPVDEVLDKGIQDLWKFTTKEAGNLMGQIQKIGIADRAVRLQEAQVLMVAKAMSALFDHLQLSEQQQIAGRDVVLGALQAAEEPAGLLDSPSALPVLREQTFEEPPEGMDWLS